MSSLDIKKATHRMTRQKATAKKPYCFTWVGLPNVFLVGVNYRRCSDCSNVSADIPAPIKLWSMLASKVALKPSALDGKEIRFLRKFAGKNASAFATLVGVSVEQVSRWEHDHNRPEIATDRLIRIIAKPELAKVVVSLSFDSSVVNNYVLHYNEGEWY